MALSVTPTDEMKTLTVGEKIYEIVDDHAREDVSEVKADLSDKVDTEQMANCELVQIEASDNRCDMNAIVQNKTVNWYTGAISDSTSNCLYYINVTPGDVLYFWALNSNSQIVSMQGKTFSTYDSSGNHTTQGSNIYAHEYTVPTGVYKLVVALNQNWVNDGYKFIIIFNDNAQPTFYEPYSDAHSEYYAKNEFLENATIIGEKKIEILSYPNNRTYNYNGVVSDNSNFLITDCVEVYPDDVINAAGYSYVDTANNTKTNIITFLSPDFTYVSGVYSEETSGVLTAENVSVPSGAKYVVFGKHVSLGVSSSYGYITRKYANIALTKGPSIPKKILPVLSKKKTISILGDSISQGEVATDRPNDSYAGILRQLFALEYGNNMNYGFVSMSRATDMVKLTSWTGWTESVGSTTAIGGDEYSTSTENATLTFRIGKQFNKVKIVTKFGESYGTLTLAQGATTFGVVDCSDGEAGAGFSDAIDISDADFTSSFTITASGTVSVSGLVLIDNVDYWTFMNYGRSGAAPSVFTGDTFDIQTDADVVIYALGVNGTTNQLIDSLDEIKARFTNLDAKKIVLDLNFTTPQRNGATKHSILKKFADETNALYICVWDYVPKDVTTGYVAEGFLNTDGIHPIDAGHEFIAGLVAKTIGLSVNSKNLAQNVLNTKITWDVT